MLPLSWRMLFHFQTTDELQACSSATHSTRLLTRFERFLLANGIYCPRHFERQVTVTAQGMREVLWKVGGAVSEDLNGPARERHRSKLYTSSSSYPGFFYFSLRDFFSNSPIFIFSPSTRSNSLQYHHLQILSSQYTQLFPSQTLIIKENLKGIGDLW